MSDPLMWVWYQPHPYAPRRYVLQSVIWFDQHTPGRHNLYCRHHKLLTEFCAKCEAGDEGPN